MSFQSTNEEMRICFPFCYFGVAKPSRVIFYSVLWDVAIITGIFVYSVVFLDSITVAPLSVCYGLVIMLFPVVWDIRDPTGQHSILKVYKVIRTCGSIVISLLAVASFVLIFVYIANSSLESEMLHKFFSLGFFLFLFPCAVIHWGTVLGFERALKLLKSINMNETANASLELSLHRLNQVQSRLMSNQDDKKLEKVAEKSRFGNL